MRILYFVNHLPFLMTHRLPLVLAARERGHAVHVAFGGTPAENAEGLDILRDHRIPFTALPFRRARTSLREYARAPRVLHAVFDEVNPQLVHAVALKPILYAGRALKTWRLARHVGLVAAVTGMGSLFADPHPRWTRRILRAILTNRMYRACEGLWRRFIVQNRDDARIVLHNGWAWPVNEGVRTIPGAGVDVDAFTPPPPDGPEWPRGVPPAPGLAPTDDRVMVVLPARLLRDKGVVEFVEAARQLRARGSTARFVLAGGVDTENPSAISEASVRAWAAEGVVEWAGVVRDMPALWRLAAVACLPSYREGLPKALLEAMASGRPCVTTDVPGCREAVADGRNGRLVPARDATALADALGDMIDNPALRRSWGAAGRHWAEVKFSAARIHAKTLAVYDEAPPTIKDYPHDSFSTEWRKLTGDNFPY